MNNVNYIVSYQPYHAAVTVCGYGTTIAKKKIEFNLCMEIMDNLTDNGSRCLLLLFKVRKWKKSINNSPM